MTVIGALLDEGLYKRQIGFHLKCQDSNRLIADRIEAELAEDWILGV